MKSVLLSYSQAMILNDKVCMQFYGKKTYFYSSAVDARLGYYDTSCYHGTSEVSLGSVYVIWKGNQDIKF